MLSKKLINLHNNMSALVNYSAILLVTPLAAPYIVPPAILVTMLFATAAFIEHKNPVLMTLGLATDS